MAPLASMKRRAIVAAVAAAVLLVGTLLKPAAPGAPPPDETPAPMLQQVVQQREAETIFRQMRAAWPQVAPYSARIRPVAPQDDFFEIGPVDPIYVSDRFGVIIGRRQILADAADLEEGATVQVTLGDGRAFEATVAARFSDRSLAILEAPDTVALDAPPRAGPTSAGTALFAAAPRGDGHVIAPLFIAHVSSRELLTTNALDAFRGMPVFELEGQLVGILAYEDGRVRLLTMNAALEPSASMLPEPRPPASES